MTTDILTSKPVEEVRENLISTAVKFLTNPNVQRCTLESKERFLRSKGLTEIEIQKAIEKCADMIDVPSMTSELMFFHQSRRSWFRDNVLPIIIYGGFAYGAYWFYKNVIRGLLFVEGPKRKSTAECLEDLRKSMDVLNANVSTLRSDLQTQHQTSEVAALKSQLETLKCDIASVKGILLNRNQFPSIPTRAEGTSIPAWQRQAAEATSSGDTANDKPTKPLRARTHRSESAGSNSSEGEHATKNSDSSLEIIT